MLDKILAKFQFSIAEIQPFYQKWSFLELFCGRVVSFFFNISIFLKNDKQGVQTVRLDELNNIVTWANICFIFQNEAKA